MNLKVGKEYEYNFEFRDLTVNIPAGKELLKIAQKEFKVIPYELTGLVNYAYYLAHELVRMKFGEEQKELEIIARKSLIKAETMLERYFDGKLYAELYNGNPSESVKHSIFININELEV